MFHIHDKRAVCLQKARIEPLHTEIAGASEEQAAQALEVLRSVESIAATSQQSAAAAEETASTSQSLAKLAEELSDSVSGFTLN